MVCAVLQTRRDSPKAPPSSGLLSAETAITSEKVSISTKNPSQFRTGTPDVAYP